MALTITPFALANTPVGESLYRAALVGVPAQFQPQLRERVVPNKQGTNNNVTVRLVFPLARQNDQTGVWVAPNQLNFSFSMTALQNVVAATELSEAYDAFVSHLQASKSAYIAGQLANLKP